MSAREILQEVIVYNTGLTAVARRFTKYDDGKIEIADIATNVKVILEPSELKAIAFLGGDIENV